MVPIMLLMGFTAQRAVGTSFLAILIISTSALIIHNKLANVEWMTGLLLASAALWARRSARAWCSTFPRRFSRRSWRASSSAWPCTSS